MIPPGFNTSEFVSGLSTLGAYVVGAYVVVYALRVVLDVLHRRGGFR